MAQQVVLENPVIDSASCRPGRHSRFGDEGGTGTIVGKRHDCGSFVPVAQPHTEAGCAKQLAIGTEWTADRIETNKTATFTCQKVEIRREGRYTAVDGPHQADNDLCTTEVQPCDT